MSFFGQLHFWLKAVTSWIRISGSVWKAFFGWLPKDCAVMEGFAVRPDLLYTLVSGVWIDVVCIQTFVWWDMFLSAFLCVRLWSHEMCYMFLVSVGKEAVRIYARMHAQNMHTARTDKRAHARTHAHTHTHRGSVMLIFVALSHHVCMQMWYLYRLSFM